MSKVFLRADWNKREKDHITADEFSEIIEGDSEKWEEHDRETKYVDLEKSYETIDIIVRRNTDQKLFKFQYNDSPYNRVTTMNTFPIEGVEVFEKTITTTIYE